MRALIIEDEPLAAERLQRLIEDNFNDIEVLGSIDTVKESISYLTKNKENLDLVFCDIHLADGLSFEIFQNIEVDTPVIFTTAYDEYSIDAFKVNSIQYLLKPIQEKDVIEAIDKYEKYFSQRVSAPDFSQLRQFFKASEHQQPKRFLVKSGLRLIPKKADEIAIFYTDNKIVHALDLNEGKIYLTDFTLEELEERHLDTSKFFRINRKQILNIESITSMKPYTGQRLSIDLSVRCNFDIIVSREKVTQFKKWFTD